MCLSLTDAVRLEAVGLTGCLRFDRDRVEVTSTDADDHEAMLAADGCDGKWSFHFSNDIRGACS